MRRQLCVTHRVPLTASTAQRAPQLSSTFLWGGQFRRLSSHIKSNNNNKKRAVPFLAFASSSPARSFHTSSPTAGITPFLLTDVGEGIAECEVTKWHVKEGDIIDEFDLVCELKSDKANVEVTSRYKGTVRKIHYAVGDMAKVGNPLIDIETSEQSDAIAPKATATANAAPSSPQTNTNNQTTTTTTTYEKVLATPAVRRMAKEFSLDLNKVPATGRDGRVMKEDVINFLEGRSSNVAAAAKPLPITTASKSAEPIKPILYPVTVEDKEVPLRGMQRAMAKTMTAANAIPHFGYCDDVMMDELVHLRQELKAQAEKRGVKLTYMPIFLKAASLALKRYPMLNSSVNSDVTALIYKGSHNLGLAMDTPTGLVVPNIKNVQDKSILEIAAELNRLHHLGLEGKLTTEDLTGGTFTLSNIGSIGGTYASPVIMLPQVAIGALGKIQTLPRFDERDPTRLLPRKIMCVSWAADHRVVDGATMANFSNLWKSYLENPKSMLFDMH